MICKNCGCEMSDDAVFCCECGCRAGNESPAVPVTPDAAPGEAGQCCKPCIAPDPFAGMLGYAVAGFVLSMLGGIICAILGIVFSRKVQKAGGTSGLAKAGVIIGVIQLVLSVLAVITIIILYIAVIAAAIAAAQRGYRF